MKSDWQLAYIEQEVEKQKLKEINSVLLSACETALEAIMDRNKPFWQREHAMEFGENLIDTLHKAISKGR